MWFKNLRLFRLTAPFTLSAEDLEDRLAQQTFRPCAKMEFASYGWVPPLGRTTRALCHAVNGRFLVCARREEKIMPASLIAELLADKVAEIEEQQMRNVVRREREALRDEIVDQLLPQALTRSKLTYAYVSPRDGWLVVDTASLAAAEALLGLLRQSLGSLSVVPPVVKEAPASVFTGWLKEAMPAELALGNECELHDPGEEGGVVRCRRQDLFADEIQAHLAAGKQVVRLAISWRERLSLILEDDLSIKRLRFEDMVQEQRDSVDGDDKAAQFDADFALMTLELTDFLPQLMELFGGEDEAAYQASAEAA
ncbi:MAG: recombination-associated protein RdgC [Gammaproteobacteria bacterium]